MKAVTEKQILEWKEELAKHSPKQKITQKKYLDECINNINYFDD